MEAQRDTGCLTRENGTVHSILPDRVAVRCAVTDSYRHVAEALVAKPIQVGEAGRAAAALRVTKQKIEESHTSETHVVRADRTTDRQTHKQTNGERAIESTIDH